jgi:hypothetical protein
MWSWPGIFRPHPVQAAHGRASTFFPEYNTAFWQEPQCMRRSGSNHMASI